MSRHDCPVVKAVRVHRDGERCYLFAVNETTWVEASRWGLYLERGDCTLLLQQASELVACLTAALADSEVQNLVKGGD